MTFASLMTFTLVMFAVNASPGPGMAAIVGATLTSGVRAGIAVFVGSLLGDYVYFLAAILGAGAAALALGPWLKALTLIAGVYLLWIGTAPFRIRGPEPVPIVAEAGRHAIDVRTGFVSGLFVTLGNPTVIVFFLAILPAATNVEHLGASDVVVLSLVLIVVSMLVYAVIIALASATRRHVLVGGRADWANRLSGGVLALAGVWLIWDGAVHLLGAAK